MEYFTDPQKSSAEDINNSQYEHISMGKIINSSDSLDYGTTTSQLENQTRYANFVGEDPKIAFRRKLVWATAISLAILLIVSGTSFAIYQFTKSNKDNTYGQPSNAKGVSIPLEEISNKARVSLGQPSRLDIIGTVNITGVLNLNPEARPSNPQLGMIYLDKNDKRIYYYDGTGFKEFVTGSQQSTNPTNQTTNYVQLQGSGAPIAQIGNLYYGNSGFTNTLSTATLTANQTISLPNESGTLCIQNSTNCGFTAGSGTAVLLAPASTQTDNTNNSSIFINKTSGTGSLLQLQKSGTDLLSLSNTGALLVQNSADSTSALQIKTSTGGTNVVGLNYDTTNQQLTLRNKTDSATLGADIFGADNNTCTGADWADTGVNTWDHVAGSVTPLICSSPDIVAGTTYEITFTTSGTAPSGSFQFAIGGVGAAQIIKGDIVGGSLVKTANSTASFTITPNIKQYGSITIISIKPITNNESPLKISNSLGSDVLNIRAFSSSVAIGLNSLRSNTTGFQNNAIGNALGSNTTGSNNNAVGYGSLLNNTVGSTNSAYGSYSMFYNYSGKENTANGGFSLMGNTTGQGNTTSGFRSLQSNTTGSYNSSLGYYAGNAGTASQFQTVNNLLSSTMVGSYSQAYANNVLALGGQGADSVKVGIGTGLPTNQLSAESYRTNTGTVTTNGTTAIVGTGTNFTWDMVGNVIYIATNDSSVAPYMRRIVTVTDSTNITVDSAIPALTNAQYYINYVGLQVSTTGKTGVNTINPQSTLSVNIMETADALAQVAVNTQGTSNKGIVVQGSTGQTANLFEAQTNVGGVLASIGATGQAIFQNSVDSTSAFQVSNTLGDYLFKVNTDDNNVAVSTDLVVDSEGYNSGTTSYAVRFGSQYSQQAIGSKRSAGGNQNGLDFYTNSINVFNLSNSGSAVFQNSTNSTTALQVKNVAGNTVLNVDTTGNGSVRVPYVGTGNATAFQVSGNGTDIFTVDNNGNRVTVGGINGCSGSPIATSGKLCLNNSSLTGGGAGPYTSQNNTLTVNNTTVATHFANYIRVNDTSAAIGHTNYGLYVDTSTAAGTTNNSATVQGITVNGRSQNAGNLLQLQVAGTNVFNITNTGTALFQNQANSTTALQVKNAGGTNIFTVTTDTATSPGIKVGGWQDFTATTTMDTLLRLNGSTGAIVRSTSGSSVAGIQNQANFDLSQAAGGNLTSLYGMINIPNISVAPSGTLTNAFGEFVRVDNTANAAITNSYALRVGNGSGTGTVNKYGAYIENISGGSSLNYPLYLKSSAAGELFSVNGTGQTIFKNSADSTTALQVQNAAGTDILTVDTTGQNVIVGTCAASPAGQFRVCSAGDAGLTLMADTDNVNESDNPFVYLLQDNGGVRGIFGMVGNAGASPNSNYNFAGTSANAFLVGTETGNDLQFGINGCRGDDGTTGDLIPCNDAITAGGVIATFNGTTGAATFKNVTNSTTAFQVQNVAGNTLLNVDTTTARGFVSVALGNTASTNAVCSSLANATAPTANTAYELRDCNAAPAADYAEMYPVTPGTEYGDIVAVGTEMVNTYDETDGNIDWNKVKGQITRLVKSSSSYQSNVIGIVSNNYGDFTSAGHNIKEQDNPMPVALNGRVPVKISTSSSSIQPGDYITTSPDTGKAIKAEGAGTVIGKALEAWDPLSGKPTIMVYVEQGYYPGPSLSTVLQGASLDITGSATINGNTSIGGSLNVSGNTTLTNLTVNGDATFTGNLTVANISVANITVNGHIITAGNTPTAIVGTAAGVEDTLSNIPAPQVTIDGNDTAGTITVVAGANTTSGNFAEVNFNSPFSKVPKVMLNAGDEQTSNLKFYRSAETGKFYIKLSNPPTAGTTYSFDYFIVQ